ncbi:MAG: AmmeMemoRadiSam system protein B [Alphaproteobacteria bacterium]|nr:AmmeMemoRadiSam system protein B [Alphaproteobacteria bacterium]
MPKDTENETRNVPKMIIIGGVIVIILLLNFFFIRDYISSNSELINDYPLRDSDINKTREAAVAGLFYPADVYQLAKDVDGYLQMSPSKLSKRPHIMVVPHAGYMYSAQVAAKAYQRLLPFAKDIKRAIILGPSHRKVFKGVALSGADSFRTPLGRIYTDKEINSYLSAQSGFKINNAAHKNEHALEVQLPFLQKTLKNFSIIPLVYGQASPYDIAATLQPILRNNDTILIISADLSHYLDNDTAHQIDKETAQMIAEGELLEEHRSCGAVGINTAMILAQQEGLKPELLDMSTSGDVTGETDSVVGYASWVFAGEPEPETELPPLEQEVENLTNFANHNKEDLLQIAKRALAEAVNKKIYQPERDDYPNVMFNKGSSFVTLTKKNELRGCIGSLLPNTAIALDVARNTYRAAMEDTRFEPLQASEIPELKISISFLSGYEKINFKDEADLLSKIVQNEDGLVLRDGDRQGLFLPSVWRQIPDKQEFLKKLKIKAGLSPSYWSSNVKIYRFRTVEISE